MVKTNNDHENYGILKKKMEEIQNEIDTSSLSQESSSSSTPEDHNLYELTPDELEMLESGIFWVASFYSLLTYLPAGSGVSDTVIVPASVAGNYFI